MLVSSRDGKKSCILLFIFRVDSLRSSAEITTVPK